MSIETLLNCVRACMRAMHDMMYRGGFLYNNQSTEYAGYIIEITY